MENLNKTQITEDQIFFENCEKCFRSHGNNCHVITCSQVKHENTEYESQNPEYIKDLYLKVSKVEKQKCHCSRYPQIRFNFINLDNRAIETYLTCSNCRNDKLEHAVLIKDHIAKLEIQKAIAQELEKTEETTKLDRAIKRFSKMLETGKYEQ